MVSFKAPCSSSETEGIQIEGVTYTVCDALGRCVTGAEGQWDADSIVTVILSLEQQKAYVQNNAKKPILRTATVSTSWTASGNYYYQDVAVNGILESDTPIIGINPGSDNAANANYAIAMNKVFRITTSDNSIRVWALSKPAVAIPIQIKVVR